MDIRINEMKHEKRSWSFLQVHAIWTKIYWRAELIATDTFLFPNQKQNSLLFLKIFPVISPWKPILYGKCPKISNILFYKFFV